MLRPFLLIGVGGSGGKTLRGLKYQLELVLRQKGWNGGLPQAWQFIHVDTPIAQDGQDYPAPFLPAEQYKGLVSGGMNYSSVYNSVSHGGSISDALLADVRRPLPDPSRVRVAVDKGAGQYRAVGRAVVLAAPREVQVAAREAVARMSDATALGQLSTLGERLNARTDSGISSSPTVIVISSIAGGSGAGQYLDVIEIVKSSVKQSTWRDQFFSILYAPDVFDQLNVTAGMPGNALAAVSEAMNGFWTKTPSDATLEVLNAQGIAPNYGDAMSRVGPAYPFVVGRSNSKVTFANQGEVYSAVATSLAAWITDDKIQDSVDAYATANWQSGVSADVLSDTTGLMRPADHSPPFSTLGFGRVTLGRERFLEYSAERIARSVVDRVLEAHIEEDRQFLQRTESEWVDVKAAEAYEGFIRALELNEETEEFNDIIDALRDKQGLEELSTRIRSAVEQQVTVGLDKSGGLDLNTWAERMVASFQGMVDSYLAQDNANRQRQLDEWVERMPSHIARTVSSYVADYGLPVVVELLRRVSRDLTSASEGLRGESGNYRMWAERLDSFVSEDLRLAPNASSIRPDHPAVQKAFQTVGEGFEWASEARLRESAADLMEEIRRDVIDPLRAHLAGTHKQLVERASAKRTLDGRENDFEFWPRRNDSTVPRKFEPAPNERLLVEHTEYPAEFERLVTATTQRERYLDAILTVMSEVTVGFDDPALSAVERWSFVEVSQSWQPATSADPRQRTQATRKPRFEIEGDPEAYRDRARSWILRDGKPFGAYIRDTLNAYLDKDNSTPDVYARRVSTFREQFTAALGASEPLVKLNPTLLSEIHNKAIDEPPQLVFGAIPFAEGTEMYSLTKSILAAQGLWNENISPDWFADQQVESIEIFAMSAFPYQPVVMDSVMEPIARTWLAKSSTIDSREAFWRFKRARLLGEAVPAQAAVLASMLRGWYVAKALGWLERTRVDSARGPELKVWDPSARKLAAFPYPLLHPGIAEPHDYPGVVMESLMVALVTCNAQSSSAPLRPYQTLMELGGLDNTLSVTLRSWLQMGTLPEKAPTPDPVRAGSAAGTLEERQGALRSFLDHELTDFADQVVRQDPDTSVYDYPVSWEIRGQVVDAIHNLRSAVLVTRAENTGT
jgi:hypothetical protein